MIYVLILILVPAAMVVIAFEIARRRDKKKIEMNTQDSPCIENDGRWPELGKAPDFTRYHLETPPGSNAPEIVWEYELATRCFLRVTQVDERLYTENFNISEHILRMCAPAFEVTDDQIKLHTDWMDITYRINGSYLSTGSDGGIVEMYQCSPIAVDRKVQTFKEE